MCVIIVKPTGKLIPSEVIKRAWQQNPDGMGFAVWNRKWEIKKGFMRLRDAIRALQPHNKKSTKLIVHFRAATHGGRIPSLTHPFPVEFAEGRGWLFHNGVFNIHAVEENESDTSAFAKVISKMKPSFEGFCEFLKTEIAINTINTSRIAVILENSPEIFIVGKWHQEKGLYLSSGIYTLMTAEYYAYLDYYYPRNSNLLK